MGIPEHRVNALTFATHAPELLKGMQGAQLAPENSMECGEEREKQPQIIIKTSCETITSQKLNFEHDMLLMTAREAVAVYGEYLGGGFHDIIIRDDLLPSLTANHLQALGGNSNFPKIKIINSKNDKYILGAVFFWQAISHSNNKPQWMRKLWKWLVKKITKYQNTHEEQ
jgi:hypothetical protein